MSEDQEEQYRQYLRDKKRRRNLKLAYIGIVLIIVSAFTFIISIALYPKPISIAKTISTLLPTPTIIPTPGPMPSPTIGSPPTATPTSSPSPTPTPTITPTPTATPSPTPDPLENENVAHTPQANIEGVITWPNSVAKGQSVDVDVALVTTKNLDLVLTVTPTPESPGTPTVIGTLTPLGTPDVEIKDSYGPGYMAFAIADLTGLAFTITSSSPTLCQFPGQQVNSTAQCQPLDQPVVRFHWMVSPKAEANIGSQPLNVSITGLWMPSKGEKIIPPLTIMYTELYINVGSGPFGITAIVSAFISIFGAMGGIGFSVPWIWDHILKWWKARRKK